MLQDASLKFAVVREDAHIEMQLVERAAARQVLVVASGGCTALCLPAKRKSVEVTAFDINPRQLEHVEAKATAARNQAAQTDLNINHDGAEGLNQCGAFEGLFRLLRRYIETFVLGAESWRDFFAAETPPDVRTKMLGEAFGSPYWSAGFCTVFNDALLHAMFGPEATQHAVPGSYPGYFEKVIGHGLQRPDAHANPFLQHILLGCYTSDAAPLYTRYPPASQPALVQGPVESVAHLDRFDVVSMSNLFDWADDAFAAACAKTLIAGMRPGAWLVIRQLNNTRDLSRFFAPHIAFDAALGTRMQAEDRSLFYNRVLVGQRTEAA